MLLQHSVWALVVTLLLVPTPALADGKAFRFRDMSGILPLEQNEQMAAIHHRDGVQRMLITINVDLDDADNALWIFPVPGTPAEAEVDLVDRFPAFRGVDVRAEARESIARLMGIVRVTQVYPVLTAFPSLAFFGARGGIPSVVEKWGLRAATLSAVSPADLAAQLQPEHPAIAADDLSAFEPYCGEQYVFVVAWLASKEQFRREFPDLRESTATLGAGRWPCLLVEFPSPEPFYPMRPTGSYGDVEMGVWLYVFGYVQPKTHPGLQRILEVSYFEQPDLSANLAAEFTGGLPREMIRYTRIHVRTIARNFIDDLRFVPTTPPGMAYAQVVRRMSRPPLMAVMWVLLVAFLSYVSGGISGMLVFRRWRNPAVIGLYNLLTLLGLGLALHRGKLEDLSRPTEKPPLVRPKFWYLLSFTIVFMAGTVVAQLLLTLPLSVSS